VARRSRAAMYSDWLDEAALGPAGKNAKKSGVGKGKDQPRHNPDKGEERAAKGANVKKGLQDV